MIFTYHTIRVARGSWPSVGRALEGAYGVWRGEIGWYTDEGAVMGLGEVELDGEHILEHGTERVEATVRPLDPTPPREDGIYAHRWFELKTADWPEFLELSEGAWPDFERAFGVRIVGLWRSLDTSDETTRALLITRYPSLAVWESSRPYNDNTPEAARRARERFVRRATLTARTIVRVTRLVRPS